MPQSADGDSGGSADGRPPFHPSSAGDGVAAVEALPAQAKPSAAAAAVRTAPPEAKAEVAAAAIEALPTHEARADAASATVDGLPEKARVNVVSDAAIRLRGKARTDLEDRLVPDRSVTNDVWKWVVRTFAVVLVAATVALVAAVIVSFWKKVDTSTVQMLLTVFTTTAGILAGFISGRASTVRATK